ncbi:MAG TPA: hypothetical protein VLD65_00310, partial [Anaerolineales bacterium]|nr:hypothetical protein [Anaerolineales bacterium]
MPAVISNNDAQYAFDIVTKVCKEVGSGVPASPQERQRAAIIKREMETHLGVDNVVEEEFTLAPGAFLSTYPGVFCMLLATLLNISIRHITGIAPWIIALIALVFSLFPPVSFILEF